MQPTPRLRVLSDRIPQVLMFVYFCRGLSGNMDTTRGGWLFDVFSMTIVHNVIILSVL